MPTLTTAALALMLASTCLAGAAAEPAAANGSNLLVFIGQKIDIARQETGPCDRCIMLDEHYAAHYRILETVFGNYRAGDIVFDVYDHYGTPAFSTFDTVLLFVSRRPDGTWVHEKYQYYDLYKGVDGAWYGCGDPYRFTVHPDSTVRARPVQFATPVSYAVGERSPNDIAKFFPPEHFALRDGRAVCLTGVSVPELFQAKKETVLKARGIFE